MIGLLWALLLEQPLAVHTLQGIDITGAFKTIFYLQEGLSELVS